MNRPPFFTRILGQPLIAGACATFSVMVIYYWYVHQYDEYRAAFLYLYPVFGAWFLYKTVNAALHVRANKKWNESYDVMQLGAVAAKRRRQWRGLFSIVSATALVYVARPYFYYHDWHLILVVCGFALCLQLLVMFFTAIKNKRANASSSAELKPSEKIVPSPLKTHHEVLVALGVPSNSPPVSKAVKALPDYCKTLLSA